MQNPSNHHRLAYLDALRAVAAVAVCFYHMIGFLGAGGTASVAPLPLAIRSAVLDTFDLGRFGVVLFFLISGFIIPTSLKPESTLGRFAVTRFFRLYPAYWLACLLILLLPFAAPGATFGLGDVLANLTMVPKLFHRQEMSGVFWTLFVEIVFYIGCAILFALRSLEKPMTIGVVTMCLNLVTPVSILLNTFCHTALPVSFLCFHLSFLFVGSVFRLALLKQHREARLFSLLLCVQILLTVPITTGLLFPVPQAVTAQFVMHGATASALAYFFAIALFLLVAWLKTNLANPLVKLGEVSYSLYLLHMLCIAAVARLIAPVSPLEIGVYFLLSIVLSVIAANIGYRLVELPAVALGKRLVLTRKAPQVDT